MHDEFYVNGYCEICGRWSIIKRVNEINEDDKVIKREVCESCIVRENAKEK